MAPTADKLLHCLAETIALLREHDEPRWADWFERIHGWIAGDDYYGIEQLGTAFGGMGSFNDLVLGGQLSQPEYPAETLWSKKDIAANERLDSLGTQMYALLIQIKRESRKE